ncbi:hypothetical protein GPECTOR_9g524 [Gonium pectorale]|uniref:Calcineurin-like phosphoesterase domain-containing protein n=1 Tax=Gonium pectorale TaxID=33097 RepID=A0A150GT21_GONPE|nr:hypothetical protein GPECTOR_9g524 [Gonium pectorale]|eukprot:KXZ52480.1 hypothetical protein GPECTOR_9g524 [Gonium pectorale]
MKSVERLKAAQRQIEGLSPQPAAVVFLGDVIHNGYYSHDFDWYLSTRNAYTVGSEIFRNFSAPVRYLWGNHDYHTVCGNASQSHDRSGLSARLFRHFLGPTALPYSSARIGRYNFVFLNAMLGPSWDPAHPRCDTRQASLGLQQLGWLAGELRAGRPTFVFLHHPLPAAMRDEAPGERHPDVLTLLLAHSDNVMAVFSGHYHRGLDWRDAYPFPHITLPASRYDEDNWFLLSLPQRGPLRSWRILDRDKNKGGARCSETWEYPPNGEPRPLAPQPAETGSCGSPTMAEVGQVELPPLQAVSDVPGPTGHQFNPEPSCCLAYQRPFLERCLQAQDTFRAAGRNGTEVLERCVAEHGAAIHWMGRVGGSCLAPGTHALPPPAAAAHPG